MSRELFWGFVISLLLFLPMKAEAGPPVMPAKIGGTVTVDGIQLTQENDTGYTFTVTRQDGSDYDPALDDTNGLNNNDWYMININIYDAIEQPGGANPGETAVIHVYKDDMEVLLVTSPLNGEFTVGESGSTTQIDIEICSDLYYRDADEDGFGDPNDYIYACSAIAGYVDNNTDCDDGDGINYPGNPELCDGQDNNCDGSADEDFTNLNDLCTVGIGACEAEGTMICSADGSGTECSAVAGNPAADDATCDGIDDDCDGAADEDYVATATECGVGACASTGQLVCQNGATVDNCQAGNQAADDATCNGVDDDCDGAADEDYVATATECGVGACASTGQLICQNGNEVDNCQIGTSSVESCNNIDDDCDGAIDEDCTSISLTSGWNLISLSVEPHDPTIGEVLGSISGQYISVWTYVGGDDPWRFYDPSDPSASNLTTMEAGLGYWLNMSEPATLNVAGSIPSNSISLSNGWNLIGYSSSNSQDIADALASIEGEFVSVWAFIDGDWKVYDPSKPAFTELITMEPHYGYWIKTTVDNTLIFP